VAGGGSGGFGDEGGQAGGDDGDRVSCDGGVLFCGSGVFDRGGGGSTGVIGGACGGCERDGVQADRLRQHQRVFEPLSDRGGDGVLVEEEWDQCGADDQFHGWDEDADGAGAGGESFWGGSGVSRDDGSGDAAVGDCRGGIGAVGEG